MSLLDRVQKKAEQGVVGARDTSPSSDQSVPVIPQVPSVESVSAIPPTSTNPAKSTDSPTSSENQRSYSNLLLNRTNSARNGAGKVNKETSQYLALRAKVRTRLVEEMADSDAQPSDVISNRIAELVNEVIAEQAMTMTRVERQRIVETVVNDVLGLGPLEELLNDERITEVMVNGPDHVYVEQAGRLTRSLVQFDSSEQLMQVIDRIVSSIGRRVDESSPMVDARLKDGSRVNVIIPPLALKGPTITIRKFAKEALQVEDLVKFGSATEEMLTFLRACVRARLNIVVSGGTGSGKTTTLNILSGFIPEDERIVTIEDAAELQLHQEHIVSLETRPANVEGRGKISIRDLVINSLRMRPDRIVVGECRGGEALDMLQAMNTGHDGSLTTVHANSPKDSIGRMETLVLMAGTDLPSKAIREQIASAIHIIVHQSRLRDGTRRIVSIAEILGIEDNEIKLQQIFTFRQTGVDADGKVLGELVPVGIVPQCMETLRAEGQTISESIFTASS